MLSVYGLNFGVKTDSVHVRLGEREAGIVYRSPNMINFRLPPETTPDSALSIEVNGCRGNEFAVATRSR